MHISYINYCTEINFPKITLHIFICDSRNYMEKWFGNSFPGKSHFSYIKECFRNCFRNNFRLEYKKTPERGKFLALPSGGPKAGHLEGEHLKMGFRTETRTWKWDFALQFALDTLILTSLSKGIPQGKHRLDRKVPSRQGKRRLDGTARWKMPFWDVLV